LYTSAYIWKIIGYKGGPDRLLLDCFSAASYAKKDRQWLEKHCTDISTRNVLHYVHSSDKLSKELTVPFKQQVLGGWHNTEAQLEQIALEFGADKPDVPDEFATPVAKAVKRTKKKDSKGTKPDKIERISDTVQMHTDEEFDDDQ